MQITPHEESNSEADGEKCCMCNAQYWDDAEMLPYRIQLSRESDMQPVFSLGRVCEPCGTKLYMIVNP